MKKRLNVLQKRDKRIVVGIETGNTPGRFGAAVVEVSGNGGGTILDLHGFRSHDIPAELLTALSALAENDRFNPEEIAGINFLVLHHLSNLYQELLEEFSIDPENVDLVGLKCMEIGGETFPSDPAILSEMTGRIVVSRFSIGKDGGDGNLLPVSESLLQGMIEEMIDRFGLESEVREAVAVALLANESLFHESSELCETDDEGTAGSKRPRLRAVKRTEITRGGAVLCGEFFFPI